MQGRVMSVARYPDSCVGHLVTALLVVRSFYWQ